MRVPWTARRSNQSILKISLGCSLVGLMLKLKLQYFERSRMVVTLASEVIILMLREPQLEKCCVSTSAPHTLSKEKFLEPEWAGSPTTAAGELRPQDLPDGSTEEKESVQGAGPGGRPWTGLCCSETPSSSGNWCVSRSLHTPAELRVSAGVLISEGLLLQRVFCVGFGV